eukprot:7419975-Lingulodinium_polyedra.AAC.1
MAHVRPAMWQASHHGGNGRAGRRLCTRNADGAPKGLGPVVKQPDLAEGVDGQRFPGLREVCAGHGLPKKRRRACDLSFKAS